METTRRNALHGVGILAAGGAGGCLSPFGSSCVRSANFDLTAASAADIVDAYATRSSELGPLDRRLAAAAVDDEAPTMTIAGVEPDLGLLRGPVAVDGQLYEFSSRQTETATRTGYLTRFEANDSVQTAAEASATIAFEDLPEVDQRVVLSAVLNDVAAKSHGDEVDGERIGFETTRTLVYPSDDAEGESVLAPDLEYEYLTYEDLTVGLTAVETDPDVSARTFAIRAERIANSESTFVASQRASRGVDVATSSLSAEQSDIMDTAIVEEYGYSKCVDETPSAAFRELVRTIFDFEGSLRSGPSEQPRLVTYDGSWYLATYRVGVR